MYPVTAEPLLDGLDHPILIELVLEVVSTLLILSGVPLAIDIVSETPVVLFNTVETLK